MPRGGLAKMKVTFAKIKDLTLGQVFGTAAIPVTQMTKKLWVVIKKHKLMG